MLTDLGPIVRGYKSILDEDLTHATSGLSLYPAFDTGWREGDIVIAPERVTVTRHSGGSTSGYSFYATGASKLRYYVTHLRWNRAPVGRVVEKGEWLGTVGNFEGARVPHAHVGVNVELLLGAGVQLRHNTNYTHGQPTVGAQLRDLLPEEDEMTKERVLELEKAAEKYRVTRLIPAEAKDLTDAENAIFYMAGRQYKQGLDAAAPELAALRVKIANANVEIDQAKAALE